MAIDWSLASNWGTLKLGMVAPEESSQIKPSDFPTTSFNYWGLDAVEKNQFVEPLPNLILGSEILSACVQFNTEHVLYSKLRPNLNKVVVPSVAGIGTTEWIVLKPNPGLLDRYYLAYVLRTKQFVDYATANSTGARMPRARKDALRDAEIPVPCPSDPIRSLETQRRIVARIETFFAELRAARELYRKVVEDTGRLMEAVLNETYGELAKSQPIRALGDPDLCGVIPGQHIMASDYSDGPRGTAYITGPADFGNKYPDVTKWTEHPKVLCYPGDVLFTVKGSGVGRVNCAPLEGPCAIGRQVMALRPNGRALNSDYLYYALWGRFREFQDLRQGAAIPGIRKEHVQAIELPVPAAIAVQEQVVARFESFQREISEMQRSQVADLTALETVEQAVLAQAFRGEL